MCSFRAPAETRGTGTLSRPTCVGREHEVLTPDLPAAVAELFARGEPRQSDTPFAEPWPLERWPSVPTRVVACRHDRLFPLDFMRRLARERLGVQADVIDTGHLPALSRPKELGGTLDAYVG
jgi:pimeloyl-ACP methyl ester carboxylesterase